MVHSASISLHEHGQPSICRELVSWRQELRQSREARERVSFFDHWWNLILRSVWFACTTGFSILQSFPRTLPGKSHSRTGQRPMDDQLVLLWIDHALTNVGKCTPASVPYPQAWKLRWASFPATQPVRTVAEKPRQMAGIPMIYLVLLAFLGFALLYNKYISAQIQAGMSLRIEFGGALLIFSIWVVTPPERKAVDRHSCQPHAILQLRRF